jgi:hypothetical protein
VHAAAGGGARLCAAIAAAAAAAVCESLQDSSGPGHMQQHLLQDHYTQIHHSCKEAGANSEIVLMGKTAAADPGSFGSTSCTAHTTCSSMHCTAATVL